jgi:hypothetical protein
VASVIFKITVTLLRRVGWVRFPPSPAISPIVLFLLVALAPPPVAAQQTDSVRAGVTTQPPSSPPQRSSADSVMRPPMSPRRAFLTSLVLPGYAQTVFGRQKAAMLFAVVEVAAIGMARKSSVALGEAKALARDSVVDTYQIDPATGRAVLDPATGQPIPATWTASRFTPDRIRARRTHYEDWLAAIAFNHLISGADAYVAANLWDFGTNVNVTASPRSTTIIATVRFR